MLWICTDATVNWTAVAAVGQLCLGAGIAFIAYRQWKTAQAQAETARRKLRADLFDKRYSLYQRITDTLGVMVRIELDEVHVTGDVGVQPLVSIAKLSEEVAWLFDENVSALVRNEVSEATEKLAGFRFDWLVAANDSTKKEIAEQVRSAQARLRNSIGKLGKEMSPFLKLEH